MKTQIAIIGAGASGLMCAANLIENKNINITLFEKNETCAKKLLITGNGRCNVTNNVESNEFLENVPRNSRFLFSALNGFAPKDMLEFLNKNGVKTKIENNNRVFPESNKSQTIKTMFETLLSNADNTEIKYNSVITEIKYEKNKFILTQNKESMVFDKLILATGGLSYPMLGSSGDGLTFAKQLGQPITLTRAALCGIRIADEYLNLLEGVSLNVKLSYESNKLIECSEIGNVMFTSYGISGPVTHKLSSIISDNSIFNNYIYIDFLPELTKESLKQQIEERIKQNGKKQLYNFICGFVNQKVSKIILKKLGSDFYMQVSQLSNKLKNEIIENLKNMKLTCNDFDSIARATITRGGIDVKHVDSKSMQSKIIKNLYFIGEVLDVDGFSGGFNLQIAFSSAVACARAIIEEIKV